MTPTIFVILEHGELLRWFDCADYMREPSDIAVAGTDFYVCDFKVRVLALSLSLHPQYLLITVVGSQCCRLH